MSEAAVAVRIGDDVLVRTETGSRLHIPACPHLGGVFREADPAERTTMAVCTWCWAELDGVGRTYCTDLDEAMREFDCQAGTRGRVRDALRFVTWDQIWLPYSRSYVALGHQGRAVAWFGKTYVVPSLGEFLELPGYREMYRGGAPADQRVGETCSKHNLTRSVTGACELCD